MATEIRAEFEALRAAFTCCLQVRGLGGRAACDWNALQIAIRSEIRHHTHHTSL